MEYVTTNHVSYIAAWYSTSRHMPNSRYPQVRLTHPTGPSDHLDLSAGVEFYLDSETTVRVSLLKREEEGDWVVQVSGVKDSEISVKAGSEKDFMAGRANRG